ncbi:MAG: 2-amino-4-hydroxy-6-hydroxymethyldihydropteridine diphosphokinase [Rudaea sp.]|nr:2-amino-4-hydroxy-6-hydroxymethyldihydropteridine diphosphokinase [Rudaea sp.]
MAIVYIGLGSNLADPRVQVESGLRALAALPGTRVLRHSCLYQTAPWGKADQPEFVNAVAQIETALVPGALLEGLLAIERSAGRERDATRWGPRVLDLDMLVYGDVVLDAPGLHLPHPHLHERAFVLMPLCEIAPGLDIPGRGRVETLMAGLDTSTCRALEPEHAA